MPTDPRPSASATALRVVVYGAVLVAAVAGTYYATRGTQAPPAASGHDHAAMAGGAGAGATASPVSLTDDQARRIGVTYAVATMGPLAREVRTVGQITFDETRLQAFAPKVDGWVERLFVNSTGQPVAAGQPLLALYSPMLVQAQEELLLARQLSQEMTAASADARGGSTSLLESARRRLAFLDIPDREIAEIERSGQVRRTLTLYSPASGYVLEKNLVPGQRIMAGEALYRIADLRTVWVEGEVFEQDLADVRVGQMVHADLPALPGEHRMGTIAFIYPTVSPDTRTARVRVVLPNRDLRLKPGMYATLRIVGTARDRVLTVPRDAVLSTGERHVVFVRDSLGQLVPREVAPGASTHERIEILRGLAEGESVVASATFLVDAESNLGKAFGGMGDMPGMEVSAPPTPLPMRETGTPGRAPQPKAKAAGDSSKGMKHDEHAGHKMP
ncbi:MAG TPA: efflux RND transporter periplasmic adaptor subunit [Gemmatimonadaceae bacterium]|nr:efflux RND transporter periplasmic adaptor subunit [Gemmatimonadaceae bacterium]